MMKIDKSKVFTLFALTLLTASLVFVNYNMTTGVQATTIADGMTWLAAQQNIDGSWGTTYQVAKTGFAVLKFETHAIHNCTDPLNPSYLYYTQVRNGLDYIFAKAYTMTISVQPAGNPDTDGDGIGVYFVSPGSNPSTRTYETGIAMMAIAASTHPEMVVNVPGSAVNGWTYKDVVQDTVDYLAFGQNDAGLQRGGWGYWENHAGWSDNSNTGYAVLGLAYAEAATIDGKTGFACTIPAFVRSELNIWIDYIQNDVDGDTNDGGSGYSAPGQWVNILETGNLLFEMAFYGDTAATPRVQDAVDYLVRHWNDANQDPGWKGQADPLTPPFSPPASYQAMYTTMKGLEILGIAVIDGIDWQADFANVLVAQQNADGSWPLCIWDDGQLILATEWALLTLQKAAPPPPPPPQDLELYPRKVVDLGNATCTQWHELHPLKTRYYHLTSWEPGRVLSPEDRVVMNRTTFEVDEVTIDIVVKDLETRIVYWLDYECGYWIFKKNVWKSPISSKWNEIKNSEVGPPKTPRCWHLTSWEDNRDGKLSACDYIDMMPMYPNSGPTTWFHVENVTVTLKLTPIEAAPVQYYLEFIGTLEEFQAMDHIHRPVCTKWHEIWPEQGREWHLADWTDRPFLSPSDQILLTLKDPVTHEPIPGAEAWYHVDKLTVAMNLTTEGGEEHIVKFEGSLQQFKKYHWMDPNYTQWHEVNPDYCRQWYLWYWYDTNRNGILDYCDLITMIDKETGEYWEFHVESLSTDMWVTQKVCGVNITSVVPWFKSRVINGVYRAWTDPANPVQVRVTVHNNGTIPLNCTVNVYCFNATFTYKIGTQNVSNLLPCNTITLAFNWNVAVLRANTTYTLKANATCPCTATDEFIYGPVKVRLWGDVNDDGAIDILDIKRVKLALSGLIDEPFADLDGDCDVDILDLKKDKLILSGFLSPFGP